MIKNQFRTIILGLGIFIMVVLLYISFNNQAKFVPNVNNYTNSTNKPETDIRTLEVNSSTSTNTTTIENIEPENDAFDNPDTVLFTIEVANLPATQKTFLRSLGIHDDKLAVTKVMFACAEEKIDHDRLIEIQNGATPSILEGMQLIGCL